MLIEKTNNKTFIRNIPPLVRHGDVSSLNAKLEGQQKGATLSSRRHPSLATSEMYFNPLLRAGTLHETWKMIPSAHNTHTNTTLASTTDYLFSQSVLLHYNVFFLKYFVLLYNLTFYLLKPIVNYAKYNTVLFNIDINNSIRITAYGKLDSYLYC